MPLDTGTQIKAWILNQADELQDGTSDFDASAESAILEAWQDLITWYPWLSLAKDPPGVLLTAASITGLTLTIATAGLAAAGTLSVSQSLSLVGYKVAPVGENYLMRVTAHTPPSAAITLDAAPEALSGQQVVLFKDEYSVASDLALFNSGLWTRQGDKVAMKSEDFIRQEYGQAVSAGWPPTYFARIGSTKILLSSYPTAVERVEYPYTQAPVLTIGASNVPIDPQLRVVLADLALHYLMTMKSDTRAPAKLQLAQAKAQKQIDYEERMRTAVFGGESPRKMSGPYR